MKSISIIGQFPPPIHGLSKALDTLCKSKLKNEFMLKKVDLTNNSKFLINIVSLIKSNNDLYYFTISQSKFGNIRDLIILKILDVKKKKVVIHLHGGGYRKLIDNEISIFQKKLNYKALKKINGAIVLGESLKYIFRGLIDEEKIFTVPNCIDDEFLLTIEEINEKVNKTSKDFKILYLSNFIKSKGYFEVLKIAKEVKLRKIDNIKFIFAGKFFNDEDKNEFSSFIIENGLENLIEYKGIVSGMEKRNLLKETNLFILLTSYPKEGQPISIIEAMGTGNLVIATKHSG
ncbi:MAG: glycosyltransferase family 4 protein, partial [Clostridium sp.]